MRFDKSGQNDGIGAIDDRSTRRVQFWPDSNDLAVTNMDITVCELSKRSIHCHDVRASDDKVFPLRQRLTRGNV
jgi:hypothetical protein